MLGLRLDKALESRLTKFAVGTRRTRSDVVREALDEYLLRHSLDDEFKRQLALVRAGTSRHELDEVGARSADVMRLANEREGQAGGSAA